MESASPTTSTRPYFIRAVHEWCIDNGLTPYIAVIVDGSVRVPREFVRNGEIVLNIGFEATNALRLGNDCIEFKARFGGMLRDIVVPVERVAAIYARENGQGMGFPMPAAGDAAGAPEPEAGNAAQAPEAFSSIQRRTGPQLATVPDAPAEPPGDNEPPPSPVLKTRRPTFKRVK